MKHGNILSLIFINIIIIFVIFNTINAQTYSGSITLKTQAEVNNFGSHGYTKITGDLKIEDGSEDDITDLTPLSTITTVRGWLTIVGCSKLPSLNGLQNISSARHIVVSLNYLIKSLDGLSGIIGVGNFEVKYNENLERIEKITEITAITNLKIYNNPKLKSISGFSSLTTIKQDIYFVNNDHLSDYSPLSGISKKVEDVDIIDNAGITNVDWLSNITTVKGHLYIKDNGKLGDFCGLNSLITPDENGTGIGGTYDVSGNLYNPTLNDLESGDCSISLPVELTTFSADVIERKIILKWQTATELNNYGFDVERRDTSFEAKWEKIGFVEGHGNSNSPKFYEYTDNELIGGNRLYRLKQIDINGNYEYTETIEVNLDLPDRFLLYQNYPNPFNPSTTISYFLPSESNVKIEIYDVTGRTIKTFTVNPQPKGGHKVVWDGTNANGVKVSTGIYIYRFESTSLETNEHFAKSAKLMLIK